MKYIDNANKSRYVWDHKHQLKWNYENELLIYSVEHEWSKKICYSKEGCNRGHGLSAAIKLGTPELDSSTLVPDWHGFSKAEPVFGTGSKNG